VKRVIVLLGILLVSWGVILAGEKDDSENSIHKELKIVLNQDGGGYLGVFLKDVTKEDVSELGLPAERGVFLTKIAEESPAEEAGLAEGDVVVEYQSLPVMSVKQFQRLVGDTPPGREVEIGLYRDGRKMNLSAKIGAGKAHRIIHGDWGLPPQLPKGDARIYRFDKDSGEGIFQHIPDYLGKIGPWRKPAVLGIECAAMTSQMADFMGVGQEEGVLVTGVMEDSPAEAAGIQAGDIITAVNGEAVAGPGELRNRLEEGAIEIDLIRNRNQMSVSVEIGSPAKKEKPRESLRM